MSDYSHRHRRTESSGSSSSSSNSSVEESNSAAIEDMPKEQVMIYLTQNSVTHHNDEIPETLAALQKADSLGLGKKSMIPISDPFKDGHKTDQYAFGQSKAATMTWWHDDSSLSPGQVRIDGRVLTLGANDSHVKETGGYADKGVLNDGVAATIRDDWAVALEHVGLDAARAKLVCDTLMTSSTGTAKMMHSGGGACNELLQLISVLNRAEMGEFEISSFVLSGHHYSGTSFIFGELENHNYDDNVTTGDTLDVRDIELLSKV